MYYTLTFLAAVAVVFTLVDAPADVPAVTAGAITPGADALGAVAAVLFCPTAAAAGALPRAAAGADISLSSSGAASRL